MLKMKYTVGKEQVELGQIMEWYHEYALAGQSGVRYGRDYVSKGGVLGTAADLARKSTQPFFRASSVPDEIFRLSTFTHSLQGTSKAHILRAMMDTSKKAGNLRMMTEFERKFLKPGIPFYAWKKHIWKWTAGQIVKNPTKFGVPLHIQEYLERKWGGQINVDHRGTPGYQQLSGVPAPFQPKPEAEQGPLEDMLPSKESMPIASGYMLRPEISPAMTTFESLQAAGEAFKQDSLKPILEQEMGGPMLDLLKLMNGIDPTTGREIPEGAMGSWNPVQFVKGMQEEGFDLSTMLLETAINNPAAAYVTGMIPYGKLFRSLAMEAAQSGDIAAEKEYLTRLTLIRAFTGMPIYAIDPMKQYSRHSAQQGKKLRRWEDRAGKTTASGLTSGEIPSTIP